MREDEERLVSAPGKRRNRRLEIHRERLPVEAPSSDGSSSSLVPARPISGPESWCSLVLRVHAVAVVATPASWRDSSILRFLGTDIKVQQDLLRHSSARLTLDTYTQSVTTAKREAQDAVIRLLVPDDQSTLNAPA